jgi:hypothetical protein
MANQSCVSVVETGDIVLFGNSSGGERRLSRIIKFASTRETEEKTFATHVEVISRPGKILPDNLDDIKTVGISFPRMAISDLAKHTGEEIKVYRLINADRFQLGRMVEELRLRAAMNEKYGTVILVLHAMDYFINWITNLIFRFWPDIRPFTAMFFTKKSVCSSMIGKAYDKYLGISFGMKPRKLQPDDIDDYCRERPHVFKLVYQGVVI